jgi:hypothetical protein
MNLRILKVTLVSILGLGLAVPCLAGSPDGRPCACQELGSGPHDVLRGCPDDYCPKPFPRFWHLTCGEADDYCPKPFPRFWHLPCGGPDDYCYKPMPRIDRPLALDYYKCVDQGCCDKCSPTRAQGAIAPRSVVSPHLIAPR